MLNAFTNVVKREISRLAKRPYIVAVMILMPIIACFILGSTFCNGSPKDLPITILDEDNSQISRMLVRIIDSTPTCFVKYKVATMKEGKDLIIGGQSYALIVIPRDFTRDLYRMEQPQIVYYYNNNLLLIGGLLTKDVSTAVQTFMGGIDAKLQMMKGVPKDVAASRVNIIKVDEHIRSNPFLNYSWFLTFAAFAHTFQIAIAFLAIWAVGIEFKEGTTKEWMETAKGSILVGVFGKMLVYMIHFLLVIGLIYFVYIVIYGAPFEGNLLFLIFGTILFILAYHLTGIMFVAITSNLRLSFSSGAFYTSLGFTFAGMTFPNIGMPPFGKFYSALLPLRPYVDLLIDQVLRGFAPKYDMIYVWWMLGLAVLGGAFLPLLKLHTQDERLWYQI